MDVIWLSSMTMTFYALKVLYVYHFVLCTISLTHLQSLESLRPDIMMSHLRKSMPKIWQIQYGELVTIVIIFHRWQVPHGHVYKKVVHLVAMLMKVIQQLIRRLK
jgi:hypothetical protein